MGKIINNGVVYAGSVDKAKYIIYDNTDTPEITAGNIQDAIEEIDGKIPRIETEDINFNIF